MSEFHVEVVRVITIEKHPNADTLSITKVRGDYPVIIRTDEFQVGDLAVYIPIDSIVPQDDPRWSFLGEQKRIKAKKLRGIFSMGLLTKSELGWEEGKNVQEILRITKWEPQAKIEMGGKEEEAPSFFPVYTDLDSLRHYPDVLFPEEEVIITEKIHGANARFLYREGRLWVGSHKRMKSGEDENIWWQVAKRYQLETLLARYENIALYGEVYGPVQDLRYGSTTEVKLILFDAMDSSSLRYFDYEEFCTLASNLNIPTVPVLYRGPWKMDLKMLANGKSVLAKEDHIREGFVVRPLKERWDRRCGRVILKLVGEDYLLRKEA